MKTIIAEKPSVAKEIAHIVGADKREEGYMQGNGYYVTWAFGHLVQPAMPETYGMKGFHAENLPVIPDPFVLVPRQVKTENGYKPDAGVLAQIKIIGKLFDSSERIIVATDAGREGELIFRYLYAYLGCRKPFDRLWISSLTDTAIREGLQNLRDGKEYDNLYHAAKARSEADWLVGINGTQALTIAAGRGTYSVGRVQTPTLGMVCERYWENKRFESKPFWQVHFGVVDADSGNILKFTSVNRWTDKATATDIYNKVKDTGSASSQRSQPSERWRRHRSFTISPPCRKKPTPSMALRQSIHSPSPRNSTRQSSSPIQEHQAAIFRMMYLPPFPNSSRIWRIIRNMERK